MSSKMKTVYVFDLDGVVTDPANSQVNDTVVDILHNVLSSGEPLAINTGRSFDWVESNLISRLRMYQDDTVLSRLIVVCEKGGEMVTWNNNEAVITPSEFALATRLHDLAKDCFEKNKSNLQTMFWDDTKRTMATVEKKPEANLSIFHEEQEFLVEKLGAVFSDDVRIDATTVATDVELHSAGKHAGASLIFEWMQRNYPLYTRYISVGDSVSDYAMAKYFADHGEQSIFVYVGKPTNDIQDHPNTQVIITRRHYSAGVLEYFSSLSPGGPGE